MKFRTSVLLLCLVVAVAAFFAGFVLARTEGVAAAQGEKAPVASPPAIPVPPPVAPPSGKMQMPPMRQPMRSFGPVAISAAGNYVYVIYDATLHQFQADGLKLVKKTPLYEEEEAPK